MRVRVITLILALTALAGVATAQVTEPASIQQRVRLAILIRRDVKPIPNQSELDSVRAVAPGIAKAIDFALQPYKLSDNGFDVPTWADLQAAFAELEKLHVAKGYRVAANIAFAGTAQQAGSPIPQFGLPSEADLVIGVTDYLVDRAKEELVVSFLADAGTKLHSDPKLVALLPHTLVVVDRAEQMQVSSILPAMRAAALEDIDGLPQVMIRPPILETSNIAPGKLLGFQAAALVVSALDATRKGIPPVSALADLSTLGPGRMTDNHLRYALRVLGTLAREYNGGDGQLRDFLADTANRRFFVPFLFSDAIQADSNPPDFKYDLAKEFAEKHQQDVINVAALLRTMQDQTTQLRTKLGDKDVASALPDILGSAMDLAGQVVKSAAPFVDDGQLLNLLSQAKPTTDQAQNIQKLRAELASDVALYGSALDGAARVMRALAVKDYGQVVVLSVSMVADFATVKPTSSQFQYLTLASNLATAKSSDDVKQAMFAAAAPVGSFRAKRGSRPDGSVRYTFDLNAYLGAGGGLEFSSGPNTPAENAGVFGVSAPIGPELSFGGSHIPSFSIFVPLVDVGAVASYRLNGDTIVDNSKVGLRQVFAPGAYFVFGLAKRYPISLGVGGQYGGGLRRSKSTNEEANVVRLGGFLGVDMPLFRF